MRHMSMPTARFRKVVCTLHWEGEVVVKPARPNVAGSIVRLKRFSVRLCRRTCGCFAFAAATELVADVCKDSSHECHTTDRDTGNVGFAELLQLKSIVNATERDVDSAKLATALFQIGLVTVEMRKLNEGFGVAALIATAARCHAVFPVLAVSLYKIAHAADRERPKAFRVSAVKRRLHRIVQERRPQSI